MLENSGISAKIAATIPIIEKQALQNKNNYNLYIYIFAGLFVKPPSIS